MSNSKTNIEIINNMIDEQFKPFLKAESVYLTEPTESLIENMVQEEMVAKGLDPLNKDDVRAFWASKGVEFNG